MGSELKIEVNYSDQPPHFGARSAGLRGLSRQECLPRRFRFARAAWMAG
jgi:hypothetical protein